MTTAIFDFDGTIADSLRETLAAYNSVASELGLPPITEERAQDLRKLSPREAMRAVHVSLWQLPRITTAVRAAMRARIAHVQPFQGMPDTLRALWAHGCKTAIVSTNSLDNVRELLARHELDRFDALSCGASMFGKASRLRRLAKRPDLAGAELFYIGDEVRDVIAAKEAGVTSIAVAWGYGDSAALEARAPDHLVCSPAELVPLLTR